MDSRAEEVRRAGFVSGLCAGISRVAVGHPFDTAKVLAQTGQQHLLQPRALFRGIGPHLLSVGVTTSINFGIYENARLSLLRLGGDDELVPLAYPNQIAVIFTAGTIAGGVLSVVTCPLANVKILQQTARVGCAEGRPERSTAQWFRTLYQYEGRGLANLYRGYTAHWIQEGLGRGFYLAAYDLLKKAEERWRPGLSDTFNGKCAAASGAGIAGWVFTYPFDVTRSQMMRDWRREQFTGTLDTLQQTWQRGGLRSLYAGLGYTVVRAVPVACVTLLSYDYAQGWLLGRMMATDR